MRRLAIVCTVVAACASDPAQPPGAVSVTVRASGEPVAGVPVWFQEADATLVLETTTNEQGSAAALVGDGAIVSVLTRYLVDGLPDPILHTFVATRTGDELVIDQAAEEAASRSIVVELPVDAAAATYSITTSCGHVDAAVPSLMTYLSGCEDDVAVLAMSYDDAYGLLRHIYMPPVPVANNTTIDLRAEAWAPFATLEVSLTGLAGKKEAYLDSMLVLDRALMMLPGQYLSLAAGGGARSLVRPAVPATYALRATIIAAGSIEHVWVWGDGEPIAIDGAELLPATEPALDLERRALVWPAPTGGSFVDVTVRVYDITQRNHWHVVAPTDGLTMPLPDLPPALAQYEPRAGLELSHAGSVIDSTAGYEGLRAGIMNRRAHPFIAGPHGRTVVRPFGL